MGEKCVAIAKITDPTAVAARCATNGWTDHDGAIFCHIPELGLEGDNYVYCRYGLSIPYIQILSDTKLWVEPTIGDTERWVYTGFVDAAGFSPSTTDLFKMVLNVAGTRKIEATSTGLLIQDTATSKIEFSSTGIKLTYGSNTIELTSSKVSINGTAFEVTP